MILFSIMFFGAVILTVPCDGIIINGSYESIIIKCGFICKSKFWVLGCKNFVRVYAVESLRWPGCPCSSFFTNIPNIYIYFFPSFFRHDDHVITVGIYISMYSKNFALFIVYHIFLCSYLISLSKIS